MAKRKKQTPPATGVDSSQPAPLKVVSVPIDSLKPDPTNARLHSDANLAAITASLRRFGQQRPIIIDDGDVIRAGNGTWTAAKALGWKSIDVLRSNLSGAELKAFAIADNRTAELADWDIAELERQIQELSIEIPAVDLGFDEGQLEALVSGNVRQAHGFIPAKEKPTASPPTPPAATELYQILVTCQSEAQQAGLLERFEREGLPCRSLMV